MLPSCCDILVQSIWTTIRPEFRVPNDLYFYLHTIFEQIIGSSFIYYFFSAGPFDQKLRSSLIYFFHLHATIRQKYVIFFLSFIQSLCKTIRPEIRVLINLFFYLYNTIRPHLGVTLTLKFIIFLIVPTFCMQHCLYISFVIFIVVLPISFVNYIHWRAALIFRTLYPWLYEVSAVNPH